MFTPPSEPTKVFQRVMVKNLGTSIRVSKSNGHPKDETIRAQLKASNWDIQEERGDGYRVTASGATEVDLSVLWQEIVNQYNS